MNRKIIFVILACFSLISCSVASKKENKEESRVHFKNSERFYKKVTEGEITELLDKSYTLEKLDFLTEDNFEYIGKRDFYKGEIIRGGDFIEKDIVLVKTEVKNPKIIIKKDDTRFENISSIENEISVELNDDGDKEVIFLNENTIYLTLRNTKTNSEKEIMLRVPVRVKEVEEIANGVRYENIKDKKGVIKYNINTNLDGLEDSLPVNSSGNKVSWERYFGYDKYEDIDDIAGMKEVRLETLVSDNVIKTERKMVDFGIKIEDYKNNFENLLTDLSNETLKFDKEGKFIEGGFKEDLVKKLKRYEKSINGSDDELLFITEPVEKKHRIGTQKIRRKIVRNGVVIFEKVELARVGFNGITVAIADSSFDRATPLLEERLIRYTEKGLDKVEETDKKKLKRTHGLNVIGAAFDELALGNSNYLFTLIGTRNIKALILAGINRDLEIARTDDAIIRGINNQIILAASNLPTLLEDPVYSKFLAFRDKLKDSETERVKNEANADPSRKDEIYKAYYKELFALYEEFATIPEDEIIKSSDLHFRTIALDDKNGLNTSKVAKLLPRMIEDDKNLRAFNMSYGSDASVEEYIAIRDMSEEDKERATREYNENVDFRVAIQTWLEDQDRKGLSIYKEDEPGSLNIPSMLKYFKSKSKITKVDYQKLLDLRLLTLKARLKVYNELPAANENILFVVSQGNTLANSSQTRADLVNFDEYGRKVIYLDGDKKYNNSFTSIPTYLNEIEKEEAKKENREAKYNPSYRKNMLGVVGLASKLLNTGANATDDISRLWGISTSDLTSFSKLKLTIENLQLRYEKLTKELEKINQNPTKFSEEYKSEILAQIRSIDNLTSLDLDLNGRNIKFSFTRAGLAKLWVVAAEGNYSYSRRLSEEEKRYNDKLTKDPDLLSYSENIATSPFISGSSFAAPRITAIAGKIGTLFPFMSANQIKQTILTTADDDAVLEVITDEQGNERRVRKGLYGVDENIGWGISNKERAFKGPARFVKALNIEEGKEDFEVDIKSGTYEFSNDIAGAFDPLLHMVTRNALNEVDFTALYTTRDYSIEEILNPNFDTDEATRDIANFLKAAKISKVDLLTKLRPKVNEYINSLDVEERDLFVDSGLVKKGNGTLILSGVNTYKDPSIVEKGTLVVRGSSKSPFVVHRDAKLKLDMKYRENIERLTDEDFTSLIDADVINAGKLYSYSTSDRIGKRYVPIKDSSTLVAATATLDINELDLSETEKFDLEIFRKKGMNPFVKPDAIDEEDPYDAEREESDSNKDFDRKDILIVKKVNKKDLYKLTLGEKEYTPFIKLIIETQEIENDEENVTLKAYLERKRKVLADGSGNTTLELRNGLLESIENETDLTEKERLENMLSTIDWMDEQTSENLNGNILADSQLIAFDIKDLKMDLISSKLENENKLKTSFYQDYLVQNKFKIDKDNQKHVVINGLNTLITHDFKYFTVGAGFNYTNSIIRDLNLELKEQDNEKPNDLTEEEEREHEKEKERKTAKGNVFANNFGTSFLLKGEYNKGIFNSILSFDYISKTVSRRIDSREFKDVRSEDFILSLDLKGSYRFSFNQFNFIPFASLDLTTFIKGEFEEDTEFGYKSETEGFFKSKMSIGSKFEYKNENLEFGAKISYSKYLTDNTLKTKAELSSYNFKKEIKGLSLEDNIVNYEISGKYFINDKTELNVRYNGKNARTHAFNLGLKYDF